MKRTFQTVGTPILLLAVVVNLAMARVNGYAGGQEKSPASVGVKIDNFSFGPAGLTVAAGTTVTWINHDDIPHTVVSSENVFKSKVLDTDEKFSYTFAKPGSYPYFCSIHPKMVGKVVVQ